MQTKSAKKLQNNNLVSKGGPKLLLTRTKPFDRNDVQRLSHVLAYLDERSVQKFVGTNLLMERLFLKRMCSLELNQIYSECSAKKIQPRRQLLSLNHNCCPSPHRNHQFLAKWWQYICMVWRPAHCIFDCLDTWRSFFLLHALPGQCPVAKEQDQSYSLITRRWSGRPQPPSQDGSPHPAKEQKATAEPTKPRSKKREERQVSSWHDPNKSITHSDTAYTVSLWHPRSQHTEKKIYARNPNSCEKTEKGTCRHVKKARKPKLAHLLTPMTRLDTWRSRNKSCRWCSRCTWKSQSCIACLLLFQYIF